MRFHFRTSLETMRGSLWFVPAAMIFGAIVLAVIMVQLSATVPRSSLAAYPRLFGAGAQSSRQMLATIAGAMMTVASVTFSITVVAVTQASSQFTPRILRNFMNDRPSQIALGTFTGVFVYCLVVIRTVRGEEDVLFIPALAVLGAFVLAIVAIGVLVYFIHHVADSLQASSILSRVSRETIGAVERLFPVRIGEVADADRASESATVGEWCAVPARRTGYIRGLDADGLLRFATKHDVVIRMECGVGEHVVRGSTLASVTPAQRIREHEDALGALYDIGHFRTVPQDAAFGIRQMVDVAVKALSPGINDTTTAITCIDSLGAVLVALAERRVEEPRRYCGGQLRVLARGPTFASLLNTAVDEIRQNAAANASVLARLQSMLCVVGERVTGAERRGLVLMQAKRILTVAEHTVTDAVNRAEIRAEYARVQAALRRVGVAPEGDVV